MLFLFIQKFLADVFAQIYSLEWTDWKSKPRTIQYAPFSSTVFVHIGISTFLSWYPDDVQEEDVELKSRVVLERAPLPLAHTCESPSEASLCCLVFEVLLLWFGGKRGILYIHLFLWHVALKSSRAPLAASLFSLFSFPPSAGSFLSSWLPTRSSCSLRDLFQTL